MMRRLASLVLLLLALPAPGLAEYCADYSGPVRNFLAKNGNHSTRACWPTQQQCESYLASSRSNSVHKYDYSGGCYPSGHTGSSGSGMHAKKGLSPANAAALSVMQNVLSGQPGGGKKGAGGSAAQANPQQQQLEDMKLRDQAERDEAFRGNQGDLLNNLKGDMAGQPAGTLLLKPVPQSSATEQLAGMIRENKTLEGQKLKPDQRYELPGRVPEVNPVSAEGDAGKGITPMARLQELVGKIGAGKKKVEASDREVRELEAKLAKEEAKPKEERPADDDALRKAREALEKAKADRDRAAAELQQLENQAESVRKMDAAPAETAGQ